MSQSFFDQTLKTHYFLTDDARHNPIFLLKHLTQKVYDDSIKLVIWNQLEDQAEIINFVTFFQLNQSEIFTEKLTQKTWRLQQIN